MGVGGGSCKRGYGPCHRISGDIEQIAVKVKEKMVAQDKTAWGRGMLQAYLRNPVCWGEVFSSFIDLNSTTYKILI